MEWFGRNPMGSISRSVSSLRGDHDSRRARTGLRSVPALTPSAPGNGSRRRAGRSRRGWKFARRCHAADLGARALAHVAVVATDGRIGALLGHGLDGGPAHEARALLGDVAPADRDVGSVMGRGQASPATEMGGPR